MELRESKQLSIAKSYYALHAEVEDLFRRIANVASCGKDAHTISNLSVQLDRAYNARDAVKKVLWEMGLGVQKNIGEEPKLVCFKELPDTKRGEAMWKFNDDNIISDD